MSTWSQDAEEISREAKAPKLSGRVHIIGLGNAGTFIAHSLAARQSPPPITLLMHQASFYQTFRRKKRSLAVNYNGLDDNRTGFDVEILEDKVWRRIPSGEEQHDAQEEEEIYESDQDFHEEEGHIECLIVCCKAYMTEKVIRDVRHRLSPNSTILLVQNGLGIVEKLNRDLFPDEHSRPHYMQGVLSHGLKKQDSYKIGHVSVGSLILSPVVTSHTPLIEAERDTHWAPTTKYLLRLLTLTPSLVATADTPAGLLQYQLERLTVSSVLGSLGAIHDCKNRDLLHNYAVSRTMRLLLLEISSVIYALPELRGIPGIEDRFSPERLRRLVINVAANRPEDASSLRNDLRYQQNTEIDFLNGWIVRRGEELGMKCVLNYMIVQLVLSRMQMISQREASAVPIDFENVILTGDNTKDD
ncbi:Uncharacterized protein PECH_007567 [Penicillium ucsense]|uniref:2-dehydropantoate 2-reductase n=1 Tax=Penicillium ucsense TaxID=2839758 RepID=A0A8J8W5G6_9EURO|nr:Uncharacterized protein PECM_004462 [Penicillium ucsense]KAF7738864.1 Uncharacterized protein PECH_007567 [Penicillium ucsense]